MSKEAKKKGRKIELPAGFARYTIIGISEAGEVMHRNEGLTALEVLGLTKYVELTLLTQLVHDID